MLKSHIDKFILAPDNIVFYLRLRGPTLSPRLNRPCAREWSCRKEQDHDVQARGIHAVVAVPLTASGN